MAAWVLAFAAGAGQVAWADEAVDVGEAPQVVPAAGYGSTAFPGMHRVLTGESMRGVGGFAGAGYGYTGDVFGLEDSHHRALGAVAVGAGIGSWLALGVRFDGRYDKHDGMDEAVVDDGWVGDPRLAVQVTRALGDSLRIGGEVVVWLPGGNAPSLVTDAISGDVLGSVAYLGMGGRLRAAANVGFRLDRSAASAENSDLLSRADRLSLGVSESNAVLLGVGLSLRAGPADIFGEFTMDKLVGGNAPSPDTSPMRVAGGVSLGLSDNLAARVVVESNLATMPEALVEQPLVPFDPRLSVIAGVHVRFGGKPREDGPLLTEAIPDDTPVKDEPPARAVLAGRVLADDGSGLANARVELTSGEETRSATTDGDGNYRIEDVPPGPVTITITADGFETVTREMELGAGAQEALESNLAKALPKGQLRGLVRAFSGKGVKAGIEIQPLGIETSTNDDGEFEVDVPPGDYTVVIDAPGYRGQRRQVSVQEDGVTIIQVDMRQKK